MEITGQSAVVTGGGSGIGAGIAAYLAKLGAKVTVIDVDRAKVEAVAQAIGGHAVVADIADGPGGEAAFKSVRERFGAARILVNVAGILIPGRILGKDGPLPLEKFRKVIDVNLVGTFNMMRLAAADMAGLAPLADGERGVIIATSSIAAYEGQIGQAAYAASKAGLVGLTLPAARDLARSGIRVVTIAPGLVATPMMLTLPPDIQKSLTDAVPFPNRLVTQDEVARLCQHVIENVALNGEVIRLDGALRLAAK
ncbi:MAG: SDR family NAD(P)-dependent oxidoreductase [Alphaproteobacteria bacterium]|nr:SDR family NAD(P)-dependent oxidoreductase [Alphaproteobacteria bacterium]